MNVMDYGSWIGNEWNPTSIEIEIKEFQDVSTQTTDLEFQESSTEITNATSSVEKPKEKSEGNENQSSSKKKWSKKEIVLGLLVLVVCGAFYLYDSTWI